MDKKVKTAFGFYFMGIHQFSVGFDWTFLLNGNVSSPSFPLLFNIGSIIVNLYKQLQKQIYSNVAIS